MKRVECNKCGNKFETARKDSSRIVCPKCGSNESLSIREGQTSRTIKTSRRSTKVSRAAVRKAVQAAE